MEQILDRLYNTAFHTPTEECNYGVKIGNVNTTVQSEYVQLSECCIPSTDIKMKF